MPNRLLEACNAGGRLAIGGWPFWRLARPQVTPEPGSANAWDRSVDRRFEETTIIAAALLFRALPRPLHPDVGANVGIHSLAWRG